MLVYLKKQQGVTDLQFDASTPRSLVVLAQAYKVFRILDTKSAASHSDSYRI
jgi:hypothetical protein